MRLLLHERTAKVTTSYHGIFLESWHAPVGTGCGREKNHSGYVTASSRSFCLADARNEVMGLSSFLVDVPCFFNWFKASSAASSHAGGRCVYLTATHHKPGILVIILEMALGVYSSTGLSIQCCR